MAGSEKKYWQTIVELIRFHTGCSCVGIRILDSDNNIPYEEYVGFTREFWESENQISLNKDQCICTRVFTGTWFPHDMEYVTENHSFCCNDSVLMVNKMDQKQLCTMRGICIEQGYRTIAVIPIKYREKVVGAIHLADKKANKLSNKTIRFIEATSVYIGEALYNLQNKKQLRKAEKDIVIQNIVNQVMVDSMPGSIMLVNTNREILVTNNLGEENGFCESSNCFCGFGNHQPCSWCKLGRALETRKPQKAQIELNGMFYALTWMPVSSELCLCLNLDLTERKNMEREMAKLDRLNLVGEISASIGHEIRNPLTSVRGFLQLMSSKESSETNKSYYNVMIEELDRANSIITEFLSLAKNKMITFEPVSLNEILETLYPLLNVEAIKEEKSIFFDKREISSILADAREIRQLIINLVLNGLEAMAPGGILTIGTRAEDNQVILYIKDQGNGIDCSILDKIGNPFVTTKAHGTGLGLAVCYSIANRHNAKIDFETGNSGTIFRIRFGAHKYELSKVAAI